MLYRYCVGGAIGIKYTVDYSITQDNIFPIHDIDIRIKALVYIYYQQDR